MGERKVLNKYIPADFDPKLVPRGSKPKDDLVPVRMMLPFSIQCATCSSFMYRGTKFNSKKEPVRGAKSHYLGIQRFRFYIKCSVCSRPVTFLTDPEKADYEMESGATRNYEVWHDKTKLEEKFSKNKEEVEKQDPMKALEHRVLESQREMEDLDNLDEIKAMNLRHVQMTAAAAKHGGKGNAGGALDTVKAVLRARDQQASKPQQPEKEEELNEFGLTASEEAMVKQIQFGKSDKKRKLTDGNGRDNLKRLNEEDEVMMERQRQQEALELERQMQRREQQMQERAKQKKEEKAKTLIVVKKKKKKKLKTEDFGNEKGNTKPEDANNSEEQAENAKENTQKEATANTSDGASAAVGGGGLGGLLGGYDSDDDSD